jgi:hypothetical protein
MPRPRQFLLRKLNARHQRPLQDQLKLLNQDLAQCQFRILDQVRPLHLVEYPRQFRLPVQLHANLLDTCFQRLLRTRLPPGAVVRWRFAPLAAGASSIHRLLRLHGFHWFHLSDSHSIL